MEENQIENLKSAYVELSNISASLFLIILKVDGKASTDDVKNIREVKSKVDGQLQETYLALQTAQLYERANRQYEDSSLNDANRIIDWANKILPKYSRLADELCPTREE